MIRLFVLPDIVPFVTKSAVPAEVPMEDPNREPDRFEFQKLMLQAMRYSSVALQFGVSLGLLGYGGYRLDQRLGWSPWGTLIGIFAGMGLGLWNMIRQLNAMEKNQEVEKSKNQNSNLK